MKKDTLVINAEATKEHTLLLSVNENKILILSTQRVIK